MSSKMIRRCWTAALAAVVAFAPVSSAKGGPEKSPFAGSYAWGNRAVTISDNGQIRGSYEDGVTKISISGRVSADGTYSFTVNVTELNLEHGPRDRRVWLRYSFEFAGTLTPDADGNIVGTPGTGGSFTWVRQ